MHFGISCKCVEMRSVVAGIRSCREPRDKKKKCFVGLVSTRVRVKKGGKRRQLVVKTKNLRIASATAAASSGTLLKAKLHTHLLPRVLGAKPGTLHGQMRLAGRRGGGRRHGLFGGGTGLRRSRVIGQRQVSRLAAGAGADKGAGSAFADSMHGAEGHG